jgi:hypothetical protein
MKLFPLKPWIKRDVDPNQLQRRLQPRRQHLISDLHIVLLHEHHMAVPKNPNIREGDVFHGNTGLSQKAHAAAVVNRVVPRLRSDDEDWYLREIREFPRGRRLLEAGEVQGWRGTDDDGVQVGCRSYRGCKVDWEFGQPVWTGIWERWDESVDEGRADRFDRNDGFDQGRPRICYRPAV